jgi:hypothetical protein
VQSPLSQDEHAAIARYLSGIRKQLQEVSDLFKSRYGKGSDIAEVALKTAASVAILEHDFWLLEEKQANLSAARKEFVSTPN